MNFEAIRATVENSTAMGYVHSCSWQKAYRNIIPDEIIDSFTVDQRTKVFVEVIQSRPEEYYLFQVDGQPAGIALLHKSHEETATNLEGEIYAIYFHPDYWGTEATQRGLQFCSDRLKNLGYKQIHIWVLKENQRARKFYEKHGFAFDGNTKEIVIGIPLLEMRYSKNI